MVKKAFTKPKSAGKGSGGGGGGARESKQKRSLKESNLGKYVTKSIGIVKGK